MPDKGLESDERELTPEAACYFLSMKLASADDDRVDELSEKGESARGIADRSRKSGTRWLPACRKPGGGLAIQGMPNFDTGSCQLTVNRELSRFVRERAGYRCEYCGLAESSFPLRFQIDHVRAEKHEEETIESNLALSCTQCNRHKGPNIAGFDAETS
jgi:hypothetical protein